MKKERPGGFSDILLSGIKSTGPSEAMDLHMLGLISPLRYTAHGGFFSHSR